MISRNVGLSLLWRQYYVPNPTSKKEIGNSARSKSLSRAVREMTALAAHPVIKGNLMLFTPYKLGALEIPNRIVMPPMTRSRAAAGDVATPLMSEYYAQRASAGLIISEGTQISRQGQGYAWTPGIYTPEQIAGWRLVTDAVHEKGGRIFAQLWHVGRVSHTALQPKGAAPVSSSTLVAEGVKVFIDPEGRGPEGGIGEMVQHSTRAL